MNKSKAFLIILASLIAGVLGMTADSMASAQDGQWIRQFGTPFADRASDVTTDSSGNLYVVGSTNGKFPGEERAGGKSDAFLSKFDPSGTELWTRQFGSSGDDRALAVAVDPQGNILVAGEASEDIPGKAAVGGGQIGAYVRKFSPSGEDLWLRHFGVQQPSRAAGVGVDRFGNVFVVGNIQGNLPGQEGLGADDAFLRAYNADREELWSRQFGTKGGDFATSVAVSAAGEVYVVGWSRDKVQEVGRLEYVTMTPFVRKYDGEGLEMWSRQDAFVRRFDGRGEEVWTRQFGTKMPQSANSVSAGPGGGIFVVGNTTGSLLEQTYLGTIDAFLLKLPDDSSAPILPDPSPTPLPDPSPTASRTAAPPTALSPSPEAGPALTPLPTPSVTEQQSAPPVSPAPSGGGCTASLSGGVYSEWLMAALIWPGLMAARLIAHGSLGRKRVNATRRRDPP